MNKKKFINKIIIPLIFLAIYGVYKYETTPLKIPSKRWDRKIARDIKRIKKRLESTYDDEFEVLRGYGSNDKYYYSFYPISYKGTHKENDTYYHGGASISGYSISTNYRMVKSSEKMNALLEPKLKALFGPNIVVATKVYGYKDDTYTDGKISLNGAVYIYGSVDSDEDREEYREKIWEFIQFLKEEEVYDLVDLGVIIVDERVLTTEFRENRELRYQLVRDRFTKECYTDEEIDERVSSIEGYWSDIVYFSDRCYTDEEEFREKRREIMSQISEEISQDKMAEPLMNINIYDNYKKEGGGKRSSYYNIILQERIISAKKWDSVGGSKIYKKKDWNSINDIEFVFEGY